jgi:hypothetical protein
MTRSRAKEFLAGLLAAQVQKATINIWGTGLKAVLSITTWLLLGQ